MTYYDATAQQQIYEYQQQQQQQADNQWKTVEQQHQGGHKPGEGGFSTDFESHGGGLKGLRNMIMSTDPEAMHNVAARWTAIHDSLHDTASQLKTHVNNLLDNWSGDSAEAFRTNAVNLHTSLSNGAQYAQNASAAMTDAAFSLQEAKNNMPDEPGLWDRGSRALTSERQDWQFKQDAAQMGLEAALKKDGGQLSANEEAHQKAVVVMEKLGTSYNAAAAKLDETPGKGAGEGGVWPAPPTKTYTPVKNGGGTTTSPKHEAMVTGHGGDTGSTGGVTGVRDPGAGGTTHHPTDPTGGIHGGDGGGNLHNPTTTIDGGPGGPHSGDGINGNHGGDANYHGVGLGDGRGGGATGGAHDGMYGGMGPLGAGGSGEGGVLGGGRRGGRLGGAAGEAGLGAAAESEEALAARNARLAAAKERAAAEAASGERGSGMGMGMGGLGRGNSNKKKRKARAGYLVEDEETWDVDGEPNPDVIDF